MRNLTQTTHLKADLGVEILFLAVPDLLLAWEDLLMGLEWSLTLLEADLGLDLAAPCPVGEQIASCRGRVAELLDRLVLRLDLDLRTRQGRSPADFWVDGACLEVGERLVVDLLDQSWVT